MKTAIFSIGATLLASLVFALRGHPFDPADYAVSLLLCTLFVWTFEQYRREPGEHT